MRLSCERFCTEHQQPFVRLDYAEGEPTSLTVFTAWGSNTLDLLPIIKSAETDIYAKITALENRVTQLETIVTNLQEA